MSGLFARGAGALAILRGSTAARAAAITAAHYGSATVVAIKHGQPLALATARPWNLADDADAKRTARC